MIIRAVAILVKLLTQYKMRVKPWKGFWVVVNAKSAATNRSDSRGW